MDISPRDVPFDDDDWVPTQPLPQWESEDDLTEHGPVAATAIVYRNRRLLAQAAQARDLSQRARAAYSDARARREGLRFERVGRATFNELMDHSHALISAAQRVCATSRTMRHESRLMQERVERDLRGRIKYGLVLTPTMLLDLAEEMEQRGLTELSWHYRAIASGFRPGVANQLN